MKVADTMKVAEKIRPPKLDRLLSFGDLETSNYIS